MSDPDIPDIPDIPEAVPDTPEMSGKAVPFFLTSKF